MIDLTRRRFLFGLAAVPLVVPAVTHFVMPKLIPSAFSTEQNYEIDLGPLFRNQWSRDGKAWHDGDNFVEPGILTRAVMTRSVYEADGFGGLTLPMPA